MRSHANIPRAPLSPSRRRFLANSGLTAAGLALAGCSSPLAVGITGAGPSREALTFWSLLGGGDGVVMAGMIDKYKKAHPNLDLTSVTLGWGDPYYTKLSLATIGNRPPDVGVSHLTRARILAQGGLLDPITDADLARNGLKLSDFNPSTVKMATVDGKLYAIPLDTHVQTIFYNTVICKKAGLLSPDGTLVNLDDKDRFTEACLAVKKVTKQWGLGLGVQDAVISWRQFQSFYSQAGGQVVADNGTKVVLDDDKAGEVLDFLTGLTLRKGAIPKDVSAGAAFNAFAAQQLGMLIDGDWSIAPFRDAKVPFSMARIPHLFGPELKAQADSHSLIFPHNSNRTAQRTDLALQFTKGIVEQSLTWATGGHVPAYLPTINSDAYKKLKPNSLYADEANHAVYDPTAWYSGSGSHFEAVVGTYVSAALTGQTSISGALKSMRRDLEKLAKTPSPVGS